LMYFVRFVIFPDKPFITHLKISPINVEHKATVSERSNVTLFCTGHGNPAPVWSWTFVTVRTLLIKPLHDTVITHIKFL